MTQIIRAEFEVKDENARQVTVVFRGGNIAGNIVRCRIEADDPSAITVKHMQSGNIMVLMPEEGVPAPTFNDLPLKLEFMIATHAHVLLHVSKPVRGVAYVVIHQVDPVKPPPEYAFGLIPRGT